MRRTFCMAVLAAARRVRIPRGLLASALYLLRPAGARDFTPADAWRAAGEGGRA